MEKKRKKKSERKKEKSSSSHLTNFLIDDDVDPMNVIAQPNVSAYYDSDFDLQKENIPPVCEKKSSCLKEPFQAFFVLLFKNKRPKKKNLSLSLFLSKRYLTPFSFFSLPFFSFLFPLFIFKKGTFDAKK